MIERTTSLIATRGEQVVVDGLGLRGRSQTDFKVFPIVQPTHVLCGSEYYITRMPKPPRPSSESVTSRYGYKSRLCPPASHLSTSQ